MVEFEPVVTNLQQQVDMALARINGTRKLRSDDTEITLAPEYERARQELRIILYDLPENVRCLTVNIDIPPYPKRPTKEIDSLNRNLRDLLTPLADQASDFTKPVSVSLTIRPPYMPEKLKGIHFGSRARDLSEQVRETVTAGERGHISLMEINPIGEPKTSPSRDFRALIFPVPLRFVQSITLETEQKPLTPYLKRNNDGSLVAYTINYS